VEKGESLATMYASREELFEAAAKRYLSAVTQKSIRAEEEKLVYARVTKEQVEYF
jgi:pyrimidine-nucleoside phosphorylase